MASYKIKHDRPNCIGCGACVSLCPANWMMSDDGKSKPKKADILESEFDCNKEAADHCPVNVIHIIDNKTGKKII